MKPTIAAIQSTALHLAAIAALAVLIGTGHLSTDVGLPLLTAEIGLGVGVGVTPSSGSDTSSPQPVTTATVATPATAPTPVTAATGPAVTLGGKTVQLTPQQADALGLATTTPPAGSAT